MTIETLSKPGADKLASILIEKGQDNRRLKETIDPALSAEEGVGAIARINRKRLNTLARSESFVNWRGVKKLMADLEQQRTAKVVSAGADGCLARIRAAVAIPGPAW